MKFGTLEVTGSDGRRREFPLDLPTLIVGRAEGNGIVIDDMSISRRHARMLIESGRLLIEDLGSAQGTFVDGHIIEPNVPNLVEPSQAIRFGDVEARYMAPVAGAATEAGSPESLVPGLPGDEEPEDEGPLSVIRLNLTDPAAPIQPGTAAFARLVIHNRGRVVDQVTVTVPDLPPDWIVISEPTFKLLPGTRQEISIVIQPPQSPDALVGEFDYSVVVTSLDFQREAVAFGQIAVLPFEGTALGVQPLRSKRDFTLVAQNEGNTVASYALSGADDEAELQYEFEVPTLDIYPGQQRSVRFRVHQPKRKLFGPASVLPYKVIARPMHIDADPVLADGLLAVHPPLERWKKPALLAVLLMVAVGAALFWKFGLDDGGGTAVANAEAAYAGVHMCDKKEDVKVAAAKPAAAGGGSAAPLFAQNNPAWADNEYAKAKDPEFGPDWCGSTIEQCGCALTSVATVMALFNLLTMPDGGELTPASVNAWFNTQATKTNHGWVSRGYAYGDVIWTSVNELSGEIAKAKPGSPTIRFVRTGTGTEGEIRSELQAGRPIILEVPGHWIAAVGLDGDKILINDPYYADRRTLDVYKGKVKSSVLFEQSNDLSGFVITVPKSERLKVTDKAGNVVGTLNTGTDKEVTESVQLGIPGAYYSSKDAWRDPTCVESPPRPGDGTIQIFLPGNKDDYKIEVLSPDGGPPTAAFHRYDKNGNYSFESKDNTGPAVIAASFDPANIAVGGATTVPGVTPTAENGGNGGIGAGAGAGAGATASPSGVASTTTTPGAGGSATVAPTATKIPPTATPVPPSSVVVACQVTYNATPKSASLACTGTVTGTYTTTAWAVNGVSAPAPPGATTFVTSFSNDTVASVSMTACNSTLCTSGVQAVTVKFPPPGATATPSPTPTVNPSATPTPPPGNPPPVVPITCNYVSGSNPVQVNCSTTFSEPYTDITWTATNASPASVTNANKNFTTFRQGAGSVTVTAKVCYYAKCTTSSSATVTPVDPPPTPTPTVSLLISTTTSATAEYFCGSGDPISFSATVSPSSATGSVTFTVQGGGGATGSLDGGYTTATSPQTKNEGNYNVTASYSGDSGHAASTGFTTLVVENCNP